MIRELIQYMVYTTRDTMQYVLKYTQLIVLLRRWRKRSIK